MMYFQATAKSPPRHDDVEPMQEHGPKYRGKLVQTIRVKRTQASLIITEDRQSEWRELWIICGLATVALSLLLWATTRIHILTWPPVAIAGGIIALIPLISITLGVGWQVRVGVDTQANLITWRRTFLGLTMCQKRFDMNRGYLDNQTLHRQYFLETSQSNWGWLFLLGGLGTLISIIIAVQSYRRFTLRLYGLSYVSFDQRDQPQPLMVCTKKQYIAVLVQQYDILMGLTHRQTA